MIQRQVDLRALIGVMVARVRSALEQGVFFCSSS